METKAETIGKADSPRNLSKSAYDFDMGHMRFRPSLKGEIPYLNIFSLIFTVINTMPRTLTSFECTFDLKRRGRLISRDIIFY